MAKIIPTQNTDHDNNSRLFLISSKIIQHLIYLVIILVPLVVWKDFNVSLIKETFFQSIVLIMLLFYLMQTIESKKIFLKRDFFIYSLIALFLLMILATVFSANPNIAFWGSAERNQGLKSFIFYFLFFFIAIANLKSEKQIQKIFTILIWTGFIISWWGILEYLQIEPFASNETSLALLGKTRSLATFGNSMFFAGWLLMIIPMTGYRIYQSLKSRCWYSYIYWLILISQIVALFSTMTRGTIIAFVISLFITALIVAMLKKIKWLWTVLITAALFLTISFISINIPSNPLNIPQDNPIINRFTNVFSDKGTFYTRTLMWKSALKPIKERLFWGFGPDVYGSYSLLDKYYDGRISSNEGGIVRIYRVHNLFLDQLLAFGIVYLLTFVIMLVAIVWELGKKIFSNKDKDGSWFLYLTLLIIILGFIGQNLVSFPDITQYSLFFLILAIIYFYFYHDNNHAAEEHFTFNDKKKNKNFPKNIYYYFLFLLIITLLLNYLVLVPFRAEKNYLKGLKYLNTLKLPEKALSFWQRAWQKDPRNFDYCRNLAGLLLQKKDPDKFPSALQVIDKCRQIDAVEITYPYLQAKIYGLWAKSDNSQYQESEKILLDSIVFYGPKDIFYEEYLRQLLEQNRSAEAKKIWQELNKINPKLGEKYRETINKE